MRKFNKVLFGCALLGLLGVFSVPAFAAQNPTSESVETEVPAKKVVINLFDPNDPNLISITKADYAVRTTSKPTKHMDLRVNSPYKYSAYSNKNIMWSKYVFDNSGNHFKLEGSATNSNFIIIVHNNDDGQDYKYNGASDFEMDSSGLQGVKTPSSFYFGFDTKSKKSSVSVDGEVNSY